MLAVTPAVDPLAMRMWCRRRRSSEPITWRVEARDGPVSIVGQRSGLTYRDCDSIGEAQLAVVRLGVAAIERGVLEPYRIAAPEIAFVAAT
jgi:hypothetical protein